MSRRNGTDIHIRDLLAGLLRSPAISPKVADELRRWTREAGLAERGGTKTPVADEPPAALLTELGALFPALIASSQEGM